MTIEFLTSAPNVILSVEVKAEELSATAVAVSSYGNTIVNVVDGGLSWNGDHNIPARAEVGQFIVCGKGQTPGTTDDNLSTFPGFQTCSENALYSFGG
ncbi:hypothetical protein [Amycolatopsis sp. NBC_01480]|uniref:hypothetical protein n=1 Tax=Amycolatopsis sp. NBC_01480 TaxID=2903562 RepID=UPI002E29DE46|nr:hypothetical protein [Amycolatopsis sp. NBC_01480]